MRRLAASGLAWALLGCLAEAPESTTVPVDGAYQVFPDQEIQPALDRAAGDPTTKVVRVHAGTYRPSSRRQALIWLHRRHDGIRLEAVGEVTLTAANPDLASPDDPAYPAVVNHVVYFGDGISRRTELHGFRITGANGFVINSGETSPIEPNDRLPKGVYFYTDGGGIKIFGRSYPTIRNTVIADNLARPCGAGVSVEHLGFIDDSVLFDGCIFRGNRTQVTGSAIDLLPGSAATIRNSLFVGNLSNEGENYVPATGDRDYNGEHGSGALTVFAGSRAIVSRSTFTANRNGVDDRGEGSLYENNVFWANDAPGGTAPGRRYELDVTASASVRGNRIGGGTIGDLQGVLDPAQLDAPDPEFDAHYRPLAPVYRDVGYRPTTPDPPSLEESSA
ncbi:MAG: right-handed parallel beta-helix repeat-containing protein [Thermoanaerobaculia bacterium]|nr:right-handed parallel beta-helix repeat-containing protein [Thermoanaerobaculia bacterium]